MNNGHWVDGHRAWAGERLSLAEREAGTVLSRRGKKIIRGTGAEKHTHTEREREREREREEEKRERKKEAPLFETNVRRLSSLSLFSLMVPHRNW